MRKEKKNQLSTLSNILIFIPYQLGELLYRKLHLPQAALEQFQWIVKGPGKEVRPTSIFYASVHNSNPRLSVYGGGYPSDTVTNLIERSTAAGGGGHSKHPSTASNKRLSQMFPTGLGISGVAGSSPSATAGFMASPPNPMAFYNSRYKKFEFSQSLRQRSAVCIEQVQKTIDSGVSPSTPTSRRTSVADQGHVEAKTSIVAETGYNSIKKTTKAELASLVNAQEQERSATTTTLKQNSLQSVDPADQLGSDAQAAIKSAKLSGEMDQEAQGGTPRSSFGASRDGAGTPLMRSVSESSAHSPGRRGYSFSTLPNILSNAQQRRGSQQLSQGA